MSVVVSAMGEKRGIRLAPQEDLVASNLEFLKDELHEQIQMAEAAVVLDLSGIEHVDSLGISLVVGVYKSCNEKGLDFSVEGANSNLVKIFNLFKLTQYFPVQGESQHAQSC